MPQTYTFESSPTTLEERDWEAKNNTRHTPVTRTSTKDIAFNFCCIAAPTLLLTGALLTIVFKYEIDPQLQVSSTLSLNSTGFSNDSFYVNVNSTFLMFVASWMSSLAPLLTGFAITLATYPVAQKLLLDSAAPERASLMTPYQLVVALKFIDGATWNGLLDCARYSMHRQTRSVTRGAALISLASIAVVVTALAALVFAADTWLHIASTTVNVALPSVLPPTEALYSLALLPGCLATNNSVTQLSMANNSCTLDPTFDTPTFEDAMTTMQTLNNQSDTRSVSVGGVNDSLTFLRVAPAATNPSHDFTASTFATQVKCTPISQLCNLTINGNATYNCSSGAFALSGSDLAETGLVRRFFRNIDMSDDSEIAQDYGVNNPFYFAAASLNSVSAKPLTALADDPEIVSRKSIIAAVVFCEITVFDTEFDLVEDQLRQLRTQMSNSSTATLFMSGVANSPFGMPNMRAALNLAATVAESAQDFADSLAKSLSQTLLSSGAGSLQAVPALAGQQRTNMMVAKVPRVPLYLLVCANIAIVVNGLVLTLLAALTSNDGRLLQNRLTIAGIVANFFENDKARTQAETAEYLFGEYSGATEAVKVGVDRTSKGGFVFSPVLPSDNVVIETRHNTSSGFDQRGHNFFFSDDPSLPKVRLVQ